MSSQNLPSNPAGSRSGSGSESVLRHLLEDLRQKSHAPRPGATPAPVKPALWG